MSFVVSPKAKGIPIFVFVFHCASLLLILLLLLLLINVYSALHNTGCVSAPKICLVGVGQDKNALGK